MKQKLIKQMETEEYWEIANKRAGVEGIPSVLRRKYRVDEMPIRGLVRSKIWLGFKIGAMNIKSLFKGLMNRDKKMLFGYLNVKKLKSTLFYVKSIWKVEIFFGTYQMNYFLWDNHNIKS